MEHIQEIWDWRLIALSYLIAVYASYTWLRLAGKVTEVRGRALVAWVPGGAVALGCGIWAVHFTGMLALDLDTPVYYSVPVLLLSFVAPVLVALLALMIIRVGKMGLGPLLVGGLVTGLGIVVMHYLGMTSMQVGAEVTYDPFLLGLSIFIAVVASIAALLVSSRFVWKPSGERARLFKVASAFVMGLAIAGFHYTAMEAARFTPAGETPVGTLGVSSGVLGFAVAVAALLVLGLVALYATVDELLIEPNLKLRRSEQGYRSLFDHNPDGMYSMDLQGNFLSANPAWERMTGYPREELLEASCDLLIVPEQRETRGQELEAVSAGESRSVQIAIHRKDGLRLELHVNLVPMMADGKVEGAYAVAKDVTRQLLMEEEIKKSAQRFRQLFEGSVDGLIVHDTEGGIVDCNSRAAYTLGYSREELLRLNVTDIEVDTLSAEERAEREREGGTIWQRLSASEPGTLLGRHYGRHRRKDGSVYPVEVLLGSVVYGGEKMFLASHRDVTEQRRTEEALRESEKRFRAIFDGAAVGISIADTERRLQETNAAYHRLTGFTEEELYGKPIAELSHPEDVAIDEEMNRRLLAGEIERYQREKRYVRQDGGVTWIRSTVSVARDDDGEPWFLVGMVEDITDRKLLEEELTHQAFHDELTGLPNRALFRRRLEQALERSRDCRQRVGVLFMDLDNFKLVNDSLGHEYGDLLLEEVASRLVQSVRDCDTVARLSGDEFTVLLEPVSDADETLQVAERILSGLQETFELASHTVASSVSIGIANSDDEQETASRLMRNADLAMYEAKRYGKSGYKVFDSTMEEKAQDRMSLESELRRAYDNEEFTLRY